MKGRRWCYWHCVARTALPAQEKAAQWRRDHPQTKPSREQLAQYAGWRWCSGCSWVVPLDYCSGSRCKACARKAARASHVKRTYGLDPDEELALQRWQSGRCFVCGRAVKTRQLAVDHDHRTDEVRGLLCSDDRFGCNVLARRFLGDAAAVRRLLAYVEKPPLARMRDGEPPWRY